jgi:predicted nucleic acid-binding protein
VSGYFLDTSALVKRQARESGHAWVRALCDRRAGHTIAISEAALVEVVASFARMVRENPPRLSIADRDRFIRRFQQQVRRGYLVVLLNRAVLVRAAALCRIHPLRAYDAVQLACALTQRADDVAAGRPASTFVSADGDLLIIAQAEGFTVENPNTYP